MANDSKKYISLSRLSNFLDNIKAKYSQIGHKHTISDLSDYKVDTALSSTSTNPVQNKIVDAEFDAISDAMGALELAIDGKADSNHNHDDKYDAKNSASSALASAKSYTDEKIKGIPSVDAYTKAEIDTAFDEVDEAISSKADSVHNHDDVYYTETEVNTLLAGKSDTSHTHSNYVPTSRTVNGKKLNANITLSYSDVGALSADTSIPDSLSDLTSDSSHRTVTDTEKATWNAKSNFSGNYNDLTNKPTIPSIAGLATEDYVNEAVDGKADSTHNHAISEVTNLQSTLDEKATQTSLDTHTSNTTVHITSTERSNWNAAKTHADSAHAPSNAEKNQNAFSNIAVSGQTTVAADTATDTLTLVAGDNVTITTNATNDSVTISAANDNTTYSAGTGISLSGTTFSNSGVRSISTGTTKGAVSVNTGGTTTSVSVYGLGSAAYTASTAYDKAGAADTALDSAKEYTDEKVALLMNNSTEAIDSIMELATAMEENADVVDALEEAIGNKSSSTHTHTVSHTPAGTVSKPTFTGSAATSEAPSASSTVATSGHTHSVTASGTVSTPTFSGTKATISATYTPAGSVSKPTFSGSAVDTGAPSGTSATSTVASSTHTHKYTPAGTVSKPTFSGTAVTSDATTDAGKTTVYSITAVGSLPSLSASVANKCLTLTFGAGTLPTKGSGVSVATGAHTHSVTAAGNVTQPTFTGTEGTTTSISGTTSVASSGHIHSVTAAGSVTQPTFTGTEATISTSYTPAGSVSQPTFTGTAVTSDAPSATIKVASETHTHSVTAKGSVSQPTFTGTEATITTSVPKEK